jgi:hypothetical protein
MHKNTDGGWEGSWEFNYRKEMEIAALFDGKVDEDLQREAEGELDGSQEDDTEGMWTIGNDKLKLFGQGGALDLEPRPMSDALLDGETISVCRAHQLHSIQFQ